MTPHETNLDLVLLDFRAAFTQDPAQALSDLLVLLTDPDLCQRRVACLRAAQKRLNRPPRPRPVSALTEQPEGLFGLVAEELTPEQVEELHRFSCDPDALWDAHRSVWPAPRRSSAKQTRISQQETSGPSTTSVALGSNPAAIENLSQQWRKDPQSVDSTWRCFLEVSHLCLHSPPNARGIDEGSSASTHWRLVGGAARAALESLCLRYWYPIYAFIRRRGTPEASAEDLTQAFFAHLLGQAFLPDAAPQKGSFKDYLFEACRRFLVDEKTREQSQSAAPNRPVVSLDALREAAERFDLEPAAPDPEAEFDGDWAFAVLNNALETVRQQYAARGSADLFDRLRAYLPFHDGELPCRQDEASEQGSQNRGAYKQALHKLRKAFAYQVRREIARTLSDPAAVEEEIRILLANVRRIPSSALHGRPAPEDCQ
jgi:RNA polymerase sigma-70 factor (ECF subfamily)